MTPKQKKEVKERDGMQCRNCKCDDPDNLHVHHVVPLSIGGRDHPDNGVTLCTECHNAVHDSKNMKHTRLTKKGQAEKGSWGGRPPIHTDKIPEIKRLRAEGRTLKQIAEITGIGLATAHKYAKECQVA